MGVTKGIHVVYIDIFLISIKYIIALHAERSEAKKIYVDIHGHYEANVYL